MSLCVKEAFHVFLPAESDSVPRPLGNNAWLRDTSKGYNAQLKHVQKNLISGDPLSGPRPLGGMFGCRKEPLSNVSAVIMMSKNNQKCSF